MVAIKDMDMPNNCSECGLKSGSYCYFKKPPYNFNGINILNERASGCPLVDIEERKAGKWIEVWESQRDEYTGEYDEWREHKCSVCGFQEFDADRFKYCPNCGAEMRGAENE